MPRYLFSIIQPDGPAPSAEFLAPIMSDLAKVNADLTAAGARVFAAGLTPPSASEPAWNCSRWTTWRRTGGAASTAAPRGLNA